MNNLVIVCPYDEKLLNTFKQKTLVVRTDTTTHLREIQKEVNKFNRLHAIKIETDIPFSALPFHEDWTRVPLAIWCGEFGEYKQLLSGLEIIRKLNARIYLSAMQEKNFLGLRILSSLKINCGLFSLEETSHWDSILDLMHYVIYSRLDQSAVEPFGWLSHHYDPTEYTDYSVVYFDDPSKYIHMNEREQIALTHKDLLRGNFIAEGINALNRIEENKMYVDFFNRRYDIMLEMNECAFCPAFRICLGKFADHNDKQHSCKVLFPEMLEALDYAYLKRNNTQNRLWQL
jgi:hypothetical protein